MFLGDFFENFRDLFILKLFELATFFADEVIVLWVAVVVLVNFAVVCACNFAE